MHYATFKKKCFKLFKFACILSYNYSKMLHSAHLRCYAGGTNNTFVILIGACMESPSVMPSSIAFPYFNLSTDLFTLTMCWDFCYDKTMLLLAIFAVDWVSLVQDLFCWQTVFPLNCILFLILPCPSGLDMYHSN